MGVNSLLGFPQLENMTARLQSPPEAPKKGPKIDFSNVPTVLQKEQNIIVNWVASRLARERRAENLGIVPFALNESVDKDVQNATPENGVDPLLLERLEAQIGAIIAMRVAFPYAM